ncbi:MAG: protein kinase [Planctomycetota bacterium]
MQQVFVVGDEPVPGYKLVADLGGSAFYKMWQVACPDGSKKLWKVIDLVVGNAAIETRTLGLLVQLRHPNLNTLTNFWQLDDGKTLIVETDVPLFSLREHLNSYKQREETIPRDEVLNFIEQAAEGLDFLNSPRHEFQGSRVAIYHRALRPECLLVFEEGGRRLCKVSDFGLSKPVTEEVAQHSQGLLHYDYDPPEFFEGQTAPTSDQYALAINYYELRTGVLPFTGSMLQQLQARLSDAPDLSKLAEPERSIVRKALARDPSGRFDCCSTFARQLRQCFAMGNAPANRDLGSVASGSFNAPPGAPTGNATSGPRIPTPASRSGSLASFGIDPASRSGSIPSLRPTAASERPATSPASDSVAVRASTPDANPQRPTPPSAIFNSQGGTGSLLDRSRLTPLTPPSAPATSAGLSATAAPAVAPLEPAGGKGLKDLSKTNLQMLRMQVTQKKHADDDDSHVGDVNFGDEKKIPIVWVVVTLVAVAGVVTLVMNLLP